MYRASKSYQRRSAVEQYLANPLFISPEVISRVRYLCGGDESDCPIMKHPESPDQWLETSVVNLR